MSLDGLPLFPKELQREVRVREGDLLRLFFFFLFKGRVCYFLCFCLDGWLMGF